MTWKIVLLFVLLIPIGAKSQLVKFIRNPVQAQYRIFITHRPKDATHLIFRVQGPADIRKPGDWYIVTNPQLFRNAITLFEVKNRKDADWIVYYVSTGDSAQILLKPRH